jgi:hypothetical protein
MPVTTYVYLNILRKYLSPHFNIDSSSENESYQNKYYKRNYVFYRKR